VIPGEPDTNLNPDDEIFIGFCHLQHVPRGNQPHIVALPNHDAVGEDVAGRKGNMELGRDVDRSWIDQVGTETSKVARAGRVGIDASRHTASAREFLCVDAERSSQ
jgi:hypothetical protein